MVALDIRRAVLGTSIAQLHLAGQETLQAFGYFGDDVYASQGVGNPECVWVTRATRAGKQLGVMKLVSPASGHGTVIGVFSRDGAVWIAVSWAGRLYRVRWRNGVVKRTSADVIAMPFNDGYTGAIFNPVDRTWLYRHASDKRQVCVLRGDADVWAGKDRPLGKVTLGPADAPGQLMQGVCSVGTDLLYLTGHKTGGHAITVHDLLGKAKAYRVPLSLGGEPEGLYATAGPDPDTQRVYVGVSRSHTSHTVKVLADPGEHRPGDEGWWHVDPRKVSSTLLGVSAAGEKLQEREPGYNLWIREFVTDGRAWAVTGYGTRYAKDFLAKGRAA
ncbi:hypothetical protein [uncultured Friedmanniella sp.]|uniref:phage baseplate protein n=1 Tax=uncultured Friedmanniella sp. TaxID=335381 RepID=UPI0035CA7028